MDGAVPAPANDPAHDSGDGTADDEEDPEAAALAKAWREHVLASFAERIASAMQGCTSKKGIARCSSRWQGAKAPTLTSTACVPQTSNTCVPSSERMETSAGAGALQHKPRSSKGLFSRQSTLNCHSTSTRSACVRGLASFWTTCSHHQRQRLLSLPHTSRGSRLRRFTQGERWWRCVHRAASALPQQCVSPWRGVLRCRHCCVCDKVLPRGRAYPIAHVAAVHVDTGKLLGPSVLTLCGAGQGPQSSTPLLAMPSTHNHCSRRHLP